MGRYPVLLLLVQESLDIGILAVRQGSNKDIGWNDFAGIVINECHCLAGPVNFDLLARLARDAHGCAFLFGEFLVVKAKLGVHERLFACHTAGRGILGPQQSERDAGFGHLFVNVLQLRQMSF
jgi:hypothetical protein